MVARRWLTQFAANVVTFVQVICTKQQGVTFGLGEGYFPTRCDLWFK